MEIDMSNEQPAADFIISAGEMATMWGFQPHSKEGWEFVEELGIEDWQWFGGAFFFDHRAARSLASYISSEGMTLFHPEYGYFRG